MTKILLDTNAYSAFMAGDSRIFQAIIDSERLYISTVMLGELFAGFSGGSRYRENREELKRFLGKDGVEILDVSIETAEIFGEVKTGLRKKGALIPLNDIWIASHAIEMGAKLITFDKHFTGIDGLRLWDELK